MTVIGFLKQNWMLIAGALIVIALVMIFMSMKKEKYYDYEMAGCSTCSAGDAGVFDYEEMYHMPDMYYSGDEDAEHHEDMEDDGRIYEEDEIYEDDTFAGDDDAENSRPTLYEDMMKSREASWDRADGYDAQGEAMAVANDIMSTGFDEEDTFDTAGMDSDMVFAKDLMDGGMDAEEDVDMLEIDELDAEEDDYSEL
jgi:hypothetical protein